MVHETGLEPVTFALEGRCSSNWATRAYRAESCKSKITAIAKKERTIKETPKNLLFYQVLKNSLKFP